MIRFSNQTQPAAVIRGIVPCAVMLVSLVVTHAALAAPPAIAQYVEQIPTASGTRQTVSPRAATHAAVPPASAHATPSGATTPPAQGGTGSNTRSNKGSKTAPKTSRKTAPAPAGAARGEQARRDSRSPFRAAVATSGDTAGLGRGLVLGAALAVATGIVLGGLVLRRRRNAA